MIILTDAIANQTTYTAQLYVLPSGVSQGSAIALTELTPGVYVGTPPNGTPENTYLVVISNDGTEIARSVYLWDGTKEIGITSLNTDLLLAKAAAERLTTTRATNLDTVARDETANTYKADLTGIATTDQVNIAATSILSEGAASWETATGFNTIAPDNARIEAIQTALASPDDFKADLTGIPDENLIAAAVHTTLGTQLNSIELLAKVATEPITNKTLIDPAENTYTVFQDDGITPRIVKDLADDLGTASSTKVFSETPRVPE